MLASSRHETWFDAVFVLFASVFAQLLCIALGLWWVEKVRVEELETQMIHRAMRNRTMFGA